LTPNWYIVQYRKDTARIGAILIVVFVFKLEFNYSIKLIT